MHSDKEVQKKVFTRQIQKAVALKKPLVVHSRDAEQDTIEIMTKNIPKAHPIHLHCFTGSPEMALALLEAFPNLCIGFTGCITFQSAEDLRAVVKQIPLDRILLETDSPYMAPLPFRGHVCHPGMIPLVGNQVATIKGVTLEEVLDQTRKNAKRVYGV